MEQIRNQELEKKSLFMAIEKAGSQSALARLAEVSPQAIQQWVTAGRVSYKKVKIVSAKTGVEQSNLRTDL